MRTFQQIGTEVGALVEKKNLAYGSSFSTAGSAMRLLYPNGIPPEQMDDALMLVRIWDKMKRIATHRDALGENPYQDISGYGICGVHMHSGKEGQSQCNGSASAAAHQSKELLGVSALTDAKQPTTTNASVKSAESGTLISEPPSSSGLPKESAPAPNVMENACGALADHARKGAERNSQWCCAQCANTLLIQPCSAIRHEVIPYGGRLTFCNAFCEAGFREQIRLLRSGEHHA